ncbi:MAG TPA: FtsX-like permease family protein [Candidatus Polarisedimenticolia bacterium]|nr:FtsX-like permease family protein [Candidatus Polarisedimenticolia bacterium]
MFGRLLWRLLRGNRGRLAVALIAVISGATVVSALLNLDFDVGRKLTQEFRMLGPNVVIAPKSEMQPPDRGVTQPLLMDGAVVARKIAETRAPDLVGAAPYLYIVARVEGMPVVVAGTQLDEARKLNPTWKLEGGWAESGCIVGRNVARQLKLAPGSRLELKYLDRTTPLTVAWLLDSGGTEDNQILMDLAEAQKLAGTPGQIELEQLRVGGTAEAVAAYADRLAAELPGYDVRPVRQVTEAEGRLLNRTRLLIVSMVILILVLTGLCVLATMAALAMERREDVGLMKALGGSISRIVGLFLAEVSVLGGAGGLIGCAAGVALAQWMGRRVFETSISPRWEVFPLTIAMMMAVALAGALPLRLLGKIKPAVILRGE